MPRPKKDTPAKTLLTPSVVVKEALTLADSEGLETVTIRRLAKELGVTPMALYWHFRSKDELLDGMVDSIYEKIDPKLEESDTWLRQLRALLSSILDVLRAHPSVTPLFSAHSTTSASSMHTTEVVLDILRRGGFSPTEATQVARHAMSTLADLVSGVCGAVPHETPEALADTRRRTRVFLESLPPARYPRLVEAAGPLSEYDDPDAHYAFGLDLLLTGIETMAARKQ